MNNDLISRSELLEKSMPAREFARNVPDLHVVSVNSVRRAPAVDAAPVVHAHYGFTGPHIGSLYADHGTCGNCKERILIDPQHKNFCPNCGAKMDKEEA